MAHPVPGASPSPHISIDLALTRIRAGQMVIVVDDEDRENEGDLTMAADLVTPEAINFMATHGRGLICLALTEDKVAALGLPMMTHDNRSVRSTAFTVSVDARQGITTGISARERAHTVLIAARPDSRPDDLVIPGHVFPLRARRGGVLVRSGHTEGAIDLARLAGREPAGVICEIMREDGEMARLPDLERFAVKHGLGVVRIADLIQYRLSREMLVRRVRDSAASLRTGGLSGDYRALAYATEVEDTEYLALVLGDITTGPPPLVRVQTARVTRDVLGLGAAPDDVPPTPWLRMIESEGRGVFLYVMPRGQLSLLDALPAGPGEPATSAAAGATAESSAMPLRDFGLGAQVLAHLGLRTIRLLTNNPRRIAGLEGYGIQVAGCVPLRALASVVALREEEG